MKILHQWEGELIGWHDPDENRQWIINNKTRDLIDKNMTIKESV
jgi:hypothetical protein